MIRIVFVALLSLLSFRAFANDGWVTQFFLGSATNAHTSLTVHQDGYPYIVFNARYSEQPFHEAPYYIFRAGKWRGDRAWEIEVIHHKLVLQNPPPEIQYFQVSHGYNLITVNRAWMKKSLIYRLGAGIVFAHPESEVRGQPFSNLSGGPFGGGNFYASGVTIQAAVEKRIRLKKKWHLSFEAKATASYASVPIANGTADVPNLALHGVLGIGRRW